MEANENIRDTPSPHTPISTNGKAPNDNDSLTKSYIRRIQELRPRKYSQKFMQIRDVFEKKNQSSKSPQSEVSMALSGKLKKETFNRFKLTGSTQRASLAKVEGMTSEGKMMRTSEMHSSVSGSPKKESGLIGSDEDQNGVDGEVGAGEPSILLHEQQKAKEEQKFATAILQQSRKSTKANQEELHKQLQQLEELQHNQEEQLEQLVLQIQKLHIKEKTKPIKTATEATAISATITSCPL